MQNPVILISTGFAAGEYSPQRQLARYYGDALAAVGAIPVLYTGGSAPLLAGRFDGLLLSGGGDLAPQYYGQAPCTDTLCIDPPRDPEEIALARAFLDVRAPVLGVCRGVQLLNVVLGGTLIQDMGGHTDGVTHLLRTEPGSLMESLLGSRFPVNSYHHQAVSQVGQGLRVTARAEDGVIEAVEHETLPAVGVQWHPERQTTATVMDAACDCLPLFRWFAQACARDCKKEE